MFSAYPELWGQHLCIDLVNSLESDYRGTGRTVDWLPKPGWRLGLLATWGLGLDDPDEPVPMAALIEMRTFLRPLLEGWGAGTPPDEQAVQRLRTMIGLAPITRDVHSGPDGYRVEIRPFARNWSWVLAEVAVSAVELIGGGLPPRLKGCSHPHRSWPLSDRTPHHSRRRCSPP